MSDRPPGSLEVHFGFWDMLVFFLGVVSLILDVLFNLQ